MTGIWISYYLWPRVFSGRSHADITTVKCVLQRGPHQSVNTIQKVSHILTPPPSRLDTVTSAAFLSSGPGDDSCSGPHTSHPTIINLDQRVCVDTHKSHTHMHSLAQVLQKYRHSSMFTWHLQGQSCTHTQLIIWALVHETCWLYLCGAKPSLLVFAWGSPWCHTQCAASV